MVTARGFAAVEMLPRFLLPRLSWNGSLTPTTLRGPSLVAAAPRRHHHAGPSSWLVTAAVRPNEGRRDVRGLMASPMFHRAFHATARRQRDHHFDTLKFVQKLQSQGFTEEQSVAMMKVLNDVIEERCVLRLHLSPSPVPPQPLGLTRKFRSSHSIQNLTRTMVLREDAAKATYTQKVDFAKLRSELLSADSTESNTTRNAHERLTNDIAKLSSRLKDEIGRTQASVRLDLNLEKGRIREEAVGQELKIKETETKIEQEVAALREKLEQVKFQTLQWLMGVCTGFAALMLGAWRLLM